VTFLSFRHPLAHLPKAAVSYAAEKARIHVLDGELLFHRHVRQINHDDGGSAPSGINGGHPFEDDDWDRQMKRDAAAGKFGALHDAAEAEHAAGC
jgi:hypothetical protein